MITFRVDNRLVAWVVGVTARKTRGKCALSMTTKPREDVVRQLKEVRKAEGMTQEHLAELVGTKKSNISRLESGRYNPSLDFLVKVADGLGKQITVKVT